MSEYSLGLLNVYVFMMRAVLQGCQRKLNDDYIVLSWIRMQDCTPSIDSVVFYLC